MPQLDNNFVNSSLRLFKKCVNRTNILLSRFQKHFQSVYSMINFFWTPRAGIWDEISPPDVNLTGRLAAESLRTRAPMIRLKIASDLRYQRG